MSELLFLVIACLMLLFQYWMGWIDIKNIPCFNEISLECPINTVKCLTRICCMYYVIWYIKHYYCYHREYRLLLDRVTFFMSHYKVPKSIQDRVLQCYRLARSKNEIKFPIAKIGLHILPQGLYNVLISHVGKTIIQKLRTYHQCFQILTTMASEIICINYLSGDVVFTKGTAADMVYLVADGILEARTEYGEHLETMSSGDIFGEIGVLNIDGHNLRTANVYSVTDSEVFAISQEDVIKISNDYPDVKKIMLDMGKQRLQRTKTFQSKTD